jgi:hypothetical protein
LSCYCTTTTITGDKLFGSAEHAQDQAASAGSDASRSIKNAADSAKRQASSTLSAAEKKAAEAKRPASNAAHSASKRASDASHAAGESGEGIIDSLKGLYKEAEHEILEAYPELEPEPLID